MTTLYDRITTRVVKIKGDRFVAVELDGAEVTICDFDVAEIEAAKGAIVERLLAEAAAAGAAAAAERAAVEAPAVEAPAAAAAPAVEGAQLLDAIEAILPGLENEARAEGDSDQAGAYHRAAGKVRAAGAWQLAGGVLFSASSRGGDVYATKRNAAGELGCDCPARVTCWHQGLFLALELVQAAAAAAAAGAQLEAPALAAGDKSVATLAPSATPAPSDPGVATLEPSTPAAPAAAAEDTSVATRARALATRISAARWASPLAV